MEKEEKNIKELKKAQEKLKFWMYILCICILFTFTICIVICSIILHYQY